MAVLGARPRPRPTLGLPLSGWWCVCDQFLGKATMSRSFGASARSAHKYALVLATMSTIQRAGFAGDVGR
jgi:hypothetical protein